MYLWVIQMIQLKDNSKVPDSYSQHSIITELVNRDLKDLEKENFIIFPPTVKESVDLELDNYLFRDYNRHVYTGNLVGVLKKGNDVLKINSRFYDSNGGNDDYFIRYLLQKVTNINVIRNNINQDNQSSYYDLLVFLFPMYLEEALQKGIYKEYISKSYNNSNVKGPIVVARHIRNNTPFMGNIAYDTREFSYDNKLTQLIRHTIEKIQMEYTFDILRDSDLKRNTNTIVEVTQTYSRLERIKIIEQNILNPVRHGYFEEYYLLQQLCIQILNEEKIGFGDDNEEIYGIIIDVAWLWEEYLVTLLTLDYIHAENKTHKNPIYFYKNKKSPRYPDFYSDKIILDAKYKQLEEKGISREDLYQITSYLHVTKAERAGVIFPSRSKFLYKNIGELSGYGGEIFKIGLEIPQSISGYPVFLDEMKKSEITFLENLV